MHTAMDAQSSFSSSFSTTTTIMHPSCPRCRSPDTGFCYYGGGATTRPNHPALLPSLQSPAPSACSCTASAHNVGISGDARPSKRRRRRQKSQLQRPRLRCPRCGSPCTRSSGYCDAGRTKLLHREPSYGWISTDEDDDDDDGAVPAMESSSSSCSASASQPVEEASSPCGTSGGDASTTETAADVAAAAAQDATRVDTKLPEAGFLDLDGNVLGGERELTWEDIELIDCALQCYLEEEFRATFFPLEGR